MNRYPHETAQRLSDVVTRLDPWLRARLSTITVWLAIRGGWAVILHYAHHTTRQPGETPPPPGVNVTYPRNTDHALALDGEDVAAAVMAQVRELECAGEVGGLTVSRVAAPLWTALGGPPSPGWTILAHSGSDAERRAWQRRIGQVAG